MDQRVKMECPWCRRYYPGEAPNTVYVDALGFISNVSRAANTGEYLTQYPCGRCLEAYDAETEDE